MKTNDTKRCKVGELRPSRDNQRQLVSMIVGAEV